MTDYEKFLMAQGLKRRADQLANEINALFKDANEVGMFIQLGHPRTGPYYFASAADRTLSSSEQGVVVASPINIQVRAGL